MYGIFTYIYPTNGPNVGKYTIHGASGKEWIDMMTGWWFEALLKNMEANGKDYLIYYGT